MSFGSSCERIERGVAARDVTPLDAHADWAPASDRPDPISLLEAQNAQRIPWLVPVRHQRMRESAFTFYRGTASIMATDLAGSPTSGFEVQLGGDAHLSNFGAYASPERQLVFDANDFDETLTGPWEWDLKRLAASFFVACRHRQFSDKRTRRVTARVVESYQRSMGRFGDMGYLDLWYQHTGMSELAEMRDADERWEHLDIGRFERKARSKTNLQALKKLTQEVDGRFQIRSDRPVLVPIREVLVEHGPEEIESQVRDTYARYLSTVRDDRRKLLERYTLVDIALKVVGVGSVGTACYVLLLVGRDYSDPLMLQAKEANASVLEPHLHQSHYRHHGERVVQGQRQVQAQSDIFLGWTTGHAGRHFYVRQLRDWKRSVDLERTSPDEFEFYAEVCGNVLARGHARSGDPLAIASYLGDTDEFAKAIVRFSERYADQTLLDHETFQTAIDEGRLPVSDEL